MADRLAKLVSRISRYQAVAAGSIHQAVASVAATAKRLVSRDELPAEEGLRRAALKEAQRALRRAERARASRLRALRRAVRSTEREHKRLVGQAAATLVQAESDVTRRVEEARSQFDSVEAALSVELARFNAFILHQDRLLTPTGEALITEALRARVGTGSALAAARPSAFARLGSEGPINARAFRAGQGREAGRLYLLIEAPELVNCIPCHERDASAAREFAARVNVSALNAPRLAHQREAALAAAKSELEGAADRSAVERAQTQLARVEADTDAVDAARTARAEAEADSAEVDELRSRVEVLGGPRRQRGRYVTR